jgi:hypothetical protein
MGLHSLLQGWLYPFFTLPYRVKKFGHSSYDVHGMFDGRQAVNSLEANISSTEQNQLKERGREESEWSESSAV